MLRKFIRNGQDGDFVTYPELKSGIHLTLWRTRWSGHVRSDRPWILFAENVHQESTCWFLHSNTWCWPSNRFILLAIQWIFVSIVWRKWSEDFTQSRCQSSRIGSRSWTNYRDLEICDHDRTWFPEIVHGRIWILQKITLQMLSILWSLLGNKSVWTIFSSIFKPRKYHYNPWSPWPYQVVHRGLSVPPWAENNFAKVSTNMIQRCLTKCFINSIQTHLYSILVNGNLDQIQIQTGRVPRTDWPSCNRVIVFWEPRKRNSEFVEFNNDKWIETIPIHLAAILVDYPSQESTDSLLEHQKGIASVDSCASEPMDINHIISIFKNSFHYNLGIELCFSHIIWLI